MFIAVEGCVGVGKSTLAKGLSAYRKSVLLAENFEANPFLQRFYEDPTRFAIETEFAFLLLHYHQLKVQDWGSGMEVISDFSLEKDLIYADLNLRATGVREAFARVYELLHSEIPAPDLMVCLSASDDLLLNRIAKRNRDFEQKIDGSYYVEINSAYKEFFRAYEGPKVSISMDEWDFVQTPALYGELSAMINDQTLRAE